VTVVSIRRSDVPSTPRWVRGLLRPLATRWLSLDVIGAEHVPDDGPVILAASHSSYADIVALSAGIERRLTYLGSAHLSTVPGVGRLLPRLGLVPVVRGAGDAGAMARCAEVLAAGAALVIFPEGARSRDGRVYRPRSGVARLASTARCPTLPIGIRGTENAWPVGGPPRLRVARTVLLLGAPLDPPRDDSPKQRRAFGAVLHRRLAELSGREPAAELLRREAA
jgi:1-acyl-sn-glycerol-3-phosphate acyltransferase